MTGSAATATSTAARRLAVGTMAGMSRERVEEPQVLKTPVFNHRPGLRHSITWVHWEYASLTGLPNCPSVRLELLPLKILESVSSEPF